MKLTIDEKTFEVEERGGTFIVGEVPFKVTLEGQVPIITANVGGRIYKVLMEQADRSVFSVNVDGKVYKVTLEKSATAPSRSALRAATAVAPIKPTTVPGGITAPMPGKVLSVRVKEGDTVEAGTVLLVLEAMKMENEIRSTKVGVVKGVMVNPGANVNGGDCLVVIE